MGEFCRNGGAEKGGGEELGGLWVKTERPRPKAMEGDWEEGPCGQAAPGLRGSLKRLEWRTGRRMKVSYQSPSLVWQFCISGRDKFCMLVGHRELEMG